jgi:hypothetical protein
MFAELHAESGESCMRRASPTQAGSPRRVVSGVGPGLRRVRIFPGAPAATAERRLQLLHEIEPATAARRPQSLQR